MHTHAHVLLCIPHLVTVLSNGPLSVLEIALVELLPRADILLFNVSKHVFEYFHKEGFGQFLHPYIYRKCVLSYKPHRKRCQSELVPCIFLFVSICFTCMQDIFFFYLHFQLLYSKPILEPLLQMSNHGAFIT